VCLYDAIEALETEHVVFFGGNCVSGAYRHTTTSASASMT